MTSQYRHRRTSNPATAFPNPLEPGEIAVNTANRQIAIGDAQSGVIGAPLPAIAVRYFDIRAQYVANDFVHNGTALYRAKGPITPGPFNITQWDMMVGAFDPQYVAKAGDVMTGMLSLPATVPSIGTHATNKTYVDTGLAGKSTVYSATSPPAGVADNSMWFETDTGLLYVKYNDGSTSQWVIACPQPDISNFVLRSGDNMSGPLGIPLTPTLPAHATSKSYVDAQLAGKSSIIASDTPPVGAIDNSLWYETDSGATYVRYNDLNGGAQWVGIADPANTAYAAPFDAMAYSGMQVNGSMEVDQAGGGEAATNNTYKADSWILRFVGTMVARLGRSSTVVGGGSFSRIPWYLYYYVTTAQASMGAGDVAYIMHYVEGYRFNRLRWGTANAQPLTIGFWSNHDIPGTYSVSIRNSAGDRAYAATYTHNTATVEQYNVLTIPGCIDGAWDTTSGAGCTIAFTVASGATATAPAANAWANGNYIAAPGQVNGVAATDKFFRITGVVVLPGIEAPRADRSALIMRPYSEELPTCRRYLETTDFGGLYLAGGNFAAFYCPFGYAVEKRSSPTTTLLTSLTNLGWNNVGADITVTSAGSGSTLRAGRWAFGGTSIAGIKQFSVLVDARL